MKGVTGMILAAGRGERLRPITDLLPKALVPVGGRALIDYAVATFVRSGIEDLVVNLHYRGEMIREHLGDGSRFGARIRYSVEEPLLGSGGAIVHARAMLGERTLVTMNADTIADIDLRELVAYHREHGATATLVLRKDPRMEDYGLIYRGPDGRIGRFLEHRAARPGEPLEPFMFAGIQVLEPRVYAYMPAPGRAFSITADTYPAMLAAGEPLYGYPFAGRWLTVGTPAELEAARATMAAWAARGAPDG